MPDNTDTPEKRIYQQIEQSADYYPPSVYALLSTYDRLVQDTDTASANFVPISPVSLSGKNAKPFVVGILPPSSNVTGKLVDHSQSVKGINGSENTGLTKNDSPLSPTSGPQGASTAAGVIPPDGLGAGLDRALIAGVKNGSFYGQGGVLTDQWWIDYVAACGRMGVKPEDLAPTIALESKFNTAAVNVTNGTAGAFGLNQMTSVAAKSVGMPPEEFAHYDQLSPERQLYWLEKYFGNKIKGKDATHIYGKNIGDGFVGKNPGGVLYASAGYQAGNPGEYPKAEYQAGAYLANKGLDKNGDGAITYADLAASLPTPSANILANIDKAKAAIAAGATARPPANSPFGGPATPNWQKSGSTNAGTAQQATASTANTALGLNDTQVGQALQKAQAAMINATLDALNTMANTPPLKMLVNPSSFKVSSEKIISDGNQGRYGPIVEQWGDNQDKVEGSGRVAGFYAISTETNISPASTQPQGIGPGLTRIARNASQSFQNFLSLYLLYKSNGGVWIEKGDGPLALNTSSLSVLGSIYLYYDNTLYIGAFDTFTITETDDKPFTVEYSFSFTVRATFLLDNIDPTVVGGFQANSLLTVPGVSTVSATPDGIPVPDQPTQDEINAARADQTITQGNNILEQRAIQSAITSPRGEAGPPTPLDAAVSNALNPEAAKAAAKAGILAPTKGKKLDGTRTFPGDVQP